MAEKHFYEQAEFTKKYLLPYFQKNIPGFHKSKVLEVGCAEGGLLEICQNMGMYTVGVELSPERVEISKAKNPNLNINVGDVTDPKLPENLNEKFDVIIMREVIEHVPSKKAAFENLYNLLNDGGYLFVSFPPKYSPFAGHQQIAGSFLKMIPYLHLVPKIILKPVTNLLGEKKDYVEEIKHHFSTGCSIREFEKQYLAKRFKVVRKEYFFFRPIYNLRYGVPIVRLPELPVFREFISFGCECLLKKECK